MEYFVCRSVFNPFYLKYATNYICGIFCCFFFVLFALFLIFLGCLSNFIRYFIDSFVLHSQWLFHRDIKEISSKEIVMEQFLRKPFWWLSGICLYGQLNLKDLDSFCLRNKQILHFHLHAKNWIVPQGAKRSDVPSHAWSLWICM